MANSADIIWFRKTFGQEIKAAVAGTVFDVDMLTAIACQETGELWGTMRRKGTLSPAKIAALCCGDTLDQDKGRSAFPRTKSELVGHPDGQKMFEIARAALLAMAEEVPGYAFAKTKPNKFCHGYGVFQYDLQFFKVNPQYFLNKDYEKFGSSLARALGELKSGLRTLNLDGRPSITDLEFCRVAIAYNTGGYDPNRGLRQGHPSGGKYYGEWVYDYLALARATPSGDGAVPPGGVGLVAGTAITPPPAPLSASGPWFVVDTTVTSLRLRSEPVISTPEAGNVVTDLPDGQRVRAFTGQVVDGFIEVETVLGGATFHGFASAQYLVSVEDQGDVLVRAAEPAEAVSGIPAVQMPRPANVTTKRTEIAGALSLYEPGMPIRAATDAAGLCANLWAIVDYLNPANSANLRYWPRSGLTFCNIYAHDYCNLACVYLPRVWWTQSALVRIARGETVRPLYGDTITEMRANDLFRWLRDFGPNFGWRQVTSPTAAQAHANEGGVSLLVARRKEDGRSGHIVPIVPEKAGEPDMQAKRAGSEVTSPLQSQAGAVNFNYGTSKRDWWKDVKFAEYAFWVHA